MRSEVLIVAVALSTPAVPLPVLEAVTAPPPKAWPRTLPPLGPAVIVVPSVTAPVSVVPETPRIPVASKSPLAIEMPSVVAAVICTWLPRLPVLFNVPITAVPVTLPLPPIVMSVVEPAAVATP